jgi:poly(A)-specific ribonuclease
MDIGATSFAEYLPILLSDISSSCFVAIDFELSGLSFPPSAPQNKTQTVQERYAETKEAAERYQILQVGLTVCHEDPITGMSTKVTPRSMANDMQLFIL